jgi:hypothetical protein
MGFSLGELFISLGFDVDESKLKSFKNNLRDTHEEMVKLGTVAGGTIASLSLFVQHAADGSVRLSNMGSLWGANIQGAQTFANALHQVNSQISVSAGQEKFRAFTEMINAKVPVGSGAYGALALLGVKNPWANSDDVLNEIRANLPGRMASLGATPEKQRARASDLLSQIGLGDSLNAILMPEDKYHAAGQYDIQQGTIDNLSKYAKATAEFDEALNKFSTDIAGELGEKMVKVVEWLTKTLNIIDNFNNAHPGAGAAEGVAGGVAVGAGGWAILRKLGSLFAGGGAASAEASFWGTGAGAGAGAGGIGLIGSAGILGAMGSIPWVASWVGKQIGESLAGKTTFTNAQRAGIMHALNDESGMNPAAVGDHGLAYGIGQWHPDRQANFKNWSGHDIQGSSREEQLAFANYELTQGMERAAGQKIAQAQSEQEAYLLTKKYYERPAGAQNIVINVHSNAADPNEVADIVDRKLQTTISGAYAQTNQGAQ